MDRRIPIRFEIGDDLALAPFLRVCLDGKPINHCIAYDIEMGTVEQVVVTAEGAPIRNRRVADEFLTQTVRGAVTVDWCDA